MLKGEHLQGVYCTFIGVLCCREFHQMNWERSALPSIMVWWIFSQIKFLLCSHWSEHHHQSNVQALLPSNVLQIFCGPWNGDDLHVLIRGSLDQQNAVKSTSRSSQWCPLPDEMLGKGNKSKDLPEDWQWLIWVCVEGHLILQDQVDCICPE